MILLDTNVLSEPYKPEPDAACMAWLAAQPEQLLFIASVSLAELWCGVALLPAGRRRQGLEDYLRDGVEHPFKGRVLDFDAGAARAMAEVWGRARVAGRQMEFVDAALAGIALQHGFTLATRNTKDFKGCDIALINPWAGPAAKAPKAR